MPKEAKKVTETKVDDDELHVSHHPGKWSKERYLAPHAKLEPDADGQPTTAHANSQRRAIDYVKEVRGRGIEPNRFDLAALAVHHGRTR